ncbi:hypothetical protein AB9K41_21130, partial [Cribrihabitans sp. XS_ASV171]
MPYPIDQALATLEPFRRIVLLGARAPIGFFAYPGKPAVLTREGADIIPLAAAGADLDGALAGLVDALGAGSETPSVAPPVAVETVTGPATPDTLAAVLGQCIPENAIVVDESITTGRGFHPATLGAKPHTW